MTPRAKKALAGSIRKWERIVTGDGEDLGDINCPLCREYNKKSIPKDKQCRGCPIYAKTGKQYCAGSPYIRFLEVTKRECSGYASTSQARRAALAMLRFLEELHC